MNITGILIACLVVGGAGNRNRCPAGNCRKEICSRSGRESSGDS